MLLKVFQLCFWVGVLFTVASFVLGQLLDFSELDADTNTDGQGDSIISPFKPVIIAAFFTVFGGVGIIGLQYMMLGALITLPTALCSALLISFILYRFLIVPLYRAQSTSAVSQNELVGLRAMVQLDITPGGFGRITYVVNNNSYTAPAKSVDDEEILKGAKVVIVDIVRNVFLVTKM